MDSRDTPTADSALIYASYSDNGGVTFAPNQAVSNKKMIINCQQCPGSGTPKYQGDYNGIVANKMGAMLSWTDFRSNTFANYVAFFPDFGMRVSPAIDTLIGTAHYDVSIPSVKLYTDTVFLSATITTSPGSFNITFPNGNKLWTYPGSIPVEITGVGSVTPGDYTIEFVAQGSNGTPVHKRTALLRVINFAPPVAAFSANHTLSCTGSPVDFTDNSSGTPTAWSWTFQGGTPSTSNIQNPTGIVYSTPGTYDVKLVVTNLMGSDSITSTAYITAVTQGPAPVTTNQTMCQGQPVPALTATGTNIRWYSNANLTTLLSQNNSYTPAMSQPGNYTYYATQTPVGGCESQAATAVLTINPSPVFDLGNNREVCVYKSIILDATAANATSYQWSVPGVTSATLIADTTYFSVGANMIYVTVTGSNGCFKTDSIKISFVPCTGLEEINNNVSVVVFPNPAQDQINIKFTSVGPETLKVSVVNILGEIVRDETSVNINGSKDLQINLRDLSDGVYLLKFDNNTTSASHQIVIKH
jgi:PKD repeat protein